MIWETYDNREIIRRKPSPISACEVSMLRVVELDSTHTHASSKYFLSPKEKLLKMFYVYNTSYNMQITNINTYIKP